MSTSEPLPPLPQDDLVELLTKYYRKRQPRARSTKIMISVLLVLIGVWFGVGMGRQAAMAPPVSTTSDSPFGDGDSPFGRQSESPFRQ